MARIVKCRNCQSDITFMHPEDRSKKAVPIETGGIEWYSGCETQLPQSSPVRLSTPGRGGFTLHLASDEVIRAAGLPIVRVEAYSVHTCEPRPR